VKRFFATAAGRGAGASRHDPARLLEVELPKFRLITGSPKTPSAAEVQKNPRARSAKLRAMERLAA